MAERKRKRAAEEWERRKRGRRRRRSREGQGEGEELGKRQVGTVGWKGDPMEALGEEVMGRVMELLDARSVARCTAVSPAWRGVAADDRLWAPKSRITKEDLCDHAWEYRFTIAAPEYFRNLDPSWKHTGPPMRRYFHPDGYLSADPDDAVWGGHECTYTVITSFVGNGRIREHYVRINRWPPLKVSRKDDWSWELSNHLYCYNSIPDSDKKRCTGPLFPVW
nr:unnamed protein product [Digitaria exilis]